MTMSSMSISHYGLFPSVLCLKLFQLLCKIYSSIFKHIPLPPFAEGLAALLACVNISTVYSEITNLVSSVYKVVSITGFTICFN